MLRLFFLICTACLVGAYETPVNVVVKKVEISGFYIENGGKLLLLQNAPDDTEPGKWGVPAGKLKRGEDPLSGAIRELFEETGIVADVMRIVPIGAFYGSKPGVDYVFHQFILKMEDVDVRLSDEHVAYRWVAPEEIDGVPLMAGGREAYARYRALAGN